MDFVDWCEEVLRCAIEIRQADFAARTVGVSESAIADNIFAGKLQEGRFYGSEYHVPLLDAVDGLKNAGFLTGQWQAWKVTQSGLDHVQDKTRRWAGICSRQLTGEQEQLLRSVNELSQQDSLEYSHVRQVSHDELLPKLEWLDGLPLLREVARELHRSGLVSTLETMDSIQIGATYSGLVWTTRRGFTLESKFFDGLVQEWETTSVEFKRELHLDTGDQKLEFIKDLLGLVNTQASGQRWLIVGFDDKTRTYSASPDLTVTQNRIEQIIADYIDPYLDVKYTVVDYRLGQVARLEVLRDAKKLPYKVLKELNGNNNKKRIVQGQIFVRHGSQVEEPTPGELQAIVEEGSRARSI